MREQDWGLDPCKLDGWLDSKYCNMPGTGEQEEEDPPKQPD